MYIITKVIDCSGNCIKVGYVNLEDCTMQPDGGSFVCVCVCVCVPMFYLLQLSPHLSFSSSQVKDTKIKNPDFMFV